MAEKENIYKQIFELSQEAYIISDKDGNIKLANNKAMELYGYSEKEMLGLNSRQLILPEYHSTFGKIMKKVYAGDTFQGETMDIRKDGSHFHCGIYGKSVVLNGETLLMTTLRDISEDKYTLNKLKSSEEKYKLLAENIEDVIWTISPELNIIYVSHSVEKLRGFTSEEVMKQTLNEIVLPHSLIKIKKLFKEFFESIEKGKPDREAKKVEIEQQCKDGSKIWTEVVVTPFFDTQNVFQFFIGVSRNISERVASKRENKQLKDQLELQFQRMPIGLIIWDKNFNIESWNPAAESIFGYTEEEIKGVNPDDKLVPTELHQEIEAIRNRTMEGDQTVHNINQNLTKNRGLITCKWSSTPLKSPDGKILGALSMIQDISNEQKIEQELKTHRENLEEIVRKRTGEIEKQSKKLHDSQIALTFLLEDVNETRLDLEAANSKLDSVNKELEAFSYSVSHDLRAPLNRMDGFSKALLDDFSGSLDERGVHYLNRIRASSQHMASLINNILDLSRISRREIQKKEINLSEMVTNILAELTESSPERKVDFSVQEGIKVSADKTLIEILLRNLLENAWKFSQNKDKTVINCGIKIQEEKEVVFIEDNGVGFNMKYYEQLFQPFRRLHAEDEFTGTGIGLATVLRIVNRHKGEIWAESKVGEGTIFYFII